MNEKVITLPDAAEIMKRLQSAYDDPRMVEEFYPMIAQEAGRELVASGVLMMFVQKIHSFVATGYAEIFEGIMHGFVPRWIDALIDDKEVAQAAKDELQGAVNATRKR